MLDPQVLTSACPRCPITTSSYRRITRWEHEAVLEAMQRRLDRKLKTMTLRRRTIQTTRRLSTRHETCRCRTRSSLVPLLPMRDAITASAD
jgi:hypothetical protein